MQLYGSASAEPYFVACFSGEQGSTTAHLRRLPRKGRAGGAYKTLLKHRVQGAALPAMLPSSPSADYISDATLRLCFGRAVFCCPFPGELGSTTAHIRRLRFLHLPLDKNCKRDYYTKQTDNGAWGVFTLGFFLWNVLENASLRADRGGPQRKIGMRAAAENGVCRAAKRKRRRYHEREC